jgi:hypothetical protein
LARYARSEEAVADVNAARTVLGEDRLVATSTDIERRSEVAVAMAPVSVMTVMAMMTVAVMTMMAMAAMLATVSAAGGRRSNRSRGQSESGDGSEGNLAKHSCSPFQA